MTTYDKLTRALLDLAEAGLRTHCSDGTSKHFWLSEHELERAVAVELCRQCPILTVCHESAVENDHRWGVWGAVDFTRLPNGKRPKGRPKKASNSR
jgi:hypothetical protein